MTKAPRHVVSVICDHQQIDGWIEYQVDSSMIEAADAFTMRRPFDASSWNILRRDARVRIFIDGAPILDGFIDKRSKRSKEGTLEIAGRDRSGRLVQESAPRINYQGLELAEAVKRLADPWFTKVTLSDARNRVLRMGKNRRGRIPGENDPIIVKRSANGNGKVQPGQMRWAVIAELVSQAGLIAWSSADGKELFVGRPNHSQAPSFHILKAKASVSGSQSTCLDLTQEEDNGDRYSLIACVGTGGGTERDFGINVSSRRASVVDNDTADGTGRDFQYPKRLLLPEKHFDSNGDASQVASRERARRDFRRLTFAAEMPYHGQWITPVGATLFAPNTVAMITDEDHEPILEEDGLIYACSYRRSRTGGETTLLELVPTGTEIVL
jgi:prophage tail gpP-like protein